MRNHTRFDDEFICDHLLLARCITKKLILQKRLFPYCKVGLFRKRQVNMQRPKSAKRNTWERNFTSVNVKKGEISKNAKIDDAILLITP